jgi:hypothetical protein
VDKVPPAPETAGRDAWDAGEVSGNHAGAGAGAGAGASPPKQKRTIGRGSRNRKQPRAGFDGEDMTSGSRGYEQAGRLDAAGSRDDETFDGEACLVPMPGTFLNPKP